MVNYGNAVMQELQALQRIYMKTVQVVRIRQRLHGQREAVLLRIMQKMQAISHLQGEEHAKALQGILDGSEQEISALRNLLRQEKRIFKFIESEERSADRIISDAMAQLKSKEKEIHKEFGYDITVKGRKIPIGNMNNFLRSVHRFLANLKRDIRRIRRRMGHEDRFLRSRDVSHFHKFLREWDNEVKAFKRMLNDLKKVIESTPHFVREMSVPLVGSSGNGFANCRCGGHHYRGLRVVLEHDNRCNGLNDFRGHCLGRDTGTPDTRFYGECVQVIAGHHLRQAAAP